MGEPHHLLDPAVVAQIDRLELLARSLVDGFLRGLHFSARRGSSTEFVEHRAYAAGDDIRRMDWRTYGKTDRFYIKQYEDETNVRAILIVDASGSMAFGSREISKLRYACALAAAVGYILLRQRDSVGLCLLDSTVRRFIPPRGTAEHLSGIFATLDRAVAAGTTAIGAGLHRIAEMIPEGSLAIVVSDLLDDP
ncbi:MAG: DUF58 domain-containing protein, partial [Planctomycetes bacterium]|nr:DUF58 domain-containing protein [Planctomycetota bacterium]